MWWRNIKAQRKCSKLEFKLFFPSLKVSKSFFINFYGFFEFFFSQNIMGRGVGSGGRVIQESECQNKSLTKKKKKKKEKKAKISLAYFSPILRILVDPGRADGPMLTPNPKKLRIGGPVVSAKFRI